ncbi:TPA: DUF4214 domain-containing protein [Serratia marcescens]|nr:DUF4214 domain-containing protein [Serratia marcescens]
MANLYFQQQASAFYYAVLGGNADSKAYEYYGSKLQSGVITPAAFVNQLLAGAKQYAGKTDGQILTQIYTNITKTAPDNDSYIQTLLNSNDNINNMVTKLVTDVLYYDGFDSAKLANQQTFKAQIDTALFAAASSQAQSGAADVQAFHYLLGTPQNGEAINYYGTLIASGKHTSAQVAKNFVDWKAPVALYNDSQFVSLLYNNGFLRDPSAVEARNYVDSLASGDMTRVDVLQDVINTLRGAVTNTDLAAKTQFIKATHVYKAGELPELSFQEQVAALFIGVPDRPVDASGLDTWSKELAYGVTDKDLAAKLLGSPEFQKKGANLTGDAFIQHVYTAVHGVAATAAQLAIYSTQGNDKAAIMLAIINDLRSSTETDNATVSQQHAFEADIGNSLLYKTTATLSSAVSDGNAIGAVNTGREHVLSNAETAVLKNVVLNTNTASITNLKFADQLGKLTISGNAASTVNLSDNGVNTGVDVRVNNANVILNASSGADDVVVSTAANIDTGAGQFNLGAGNDNLKWVGNAESGAGNIVSSAIRADGGAGVDVLSANFITKNVNISTGTDWFKTPTANITTSATQFTNFEKIDLAGYIGKARVDTESTATNRTFDFGVLTGNASLESSKNVSNGNIKQSASSTTLGTQGFVLSGVADAVKVINVAGGSAAQLEVTDNATAASSLDFTFRENATDKFDIAFTANSDTDINAGSVSLNSSSSLLFGKALEMVNIDSGGSGDFGNILSLVGTNSQVKTINVQGDHHLDLTVGNGYSNVTAIDASGNTGGVNIDSQLTPSGSNWLFNVLKAIPLIATIPNIFEVFGVKASNNVTITGSQGNDIFSVRDNTVIEGGGGSNVLNVASSKRDSSVVINDFNYAEDTLVVQQSGLVFSNQESATKVADFGSKAGDGFIPQLVRFVADSIAGNIITGVGETLINGLFGLNNGKLAAKVGVSSVDDNHFLIIDQNDNRELDKDDTVVVLKGGASHADLVNNLYYSQVELNGINLAQFQHEQVA